MNEKRKQAAKILDTTITQAHKTLYQGASAVLDLFPFDDIVTKPSQVVHELTAEETDADIVAVPPEPEPDKPDLPPLSDEMLAMLNVILNYAVGVSTEEVDALTWAIRRLEANQLDPEATCGDCVGCCELPAYAGLVACSRRVNVKILTTTTACAKIQRKGQADATT